MSTIAKEIRELIRQTEELACNSPVYSVVHKVTSNYCDHLAAIARISEVNNETSHAKDRA